VQGIHHPRTNVRGHINIVPFKLSFLDVQSFLAIACKNLPRYKKSAEIPKICQDTKKSAKMPKVYQDTKNLPRYDNLLTVDHRYLPYKRRRNDDVRTKVALSLHWTLQDALYTIL
jgi:hypothetical protein